MSNKNMSAMDEDNGEKSALVPRLRFPEFRGAWASSPMSELYSFKGNNSLSRDKLNYEGGSFRNIHYGDIHTKFALHFRADAEPVPYINNGESHSTIRTENYCMAGDMVFADASEDMADIGKAIEIIDAGDVPLVSGLHTILARPNEGSFALGFGAYLFSSEGVRKQIQREGQGAKVLGLSATRLGNVLLHYPSKPDEQQKIADCLSSLDELITVETQKLYALKTHKKGLMQQLFPREGETVPRLRFPEFRETGGWGAESLGNICKPQQWATISSSDLVEEGYPVYGANGFIGYYTHFNHEFETVAVTCRGSTCGEVSLIPPKSYITGNSMCLDEIDDAENAYNFVYQFLKQRGFQDIISGSAQPQIVGNAIKKLKIVLPKREEQQKIADCLASLDDLITAQSQKIDVLKTHKKGLMQQLFPVLDEVVQA